MTLLRLLADFRNKSLHRIPHFSVIFVEKKIFSGPPSRGVRHAPKKFFKFIIIGHDRVPCPTINRGPWGTFLRTTVGPLTKISELFQVILCCRGRYDIFEISDTGNWIFRFFFGDSLVLTFECQPLGIFGLAARLHVDSIRFADEIIFQNKVRYLFFRFRVQLIDHIRFYAQPRSNTTAVPSLLGLALEILDNLILFDQTRAIPNLHTSYPAGL